MIRLLSTLERILFYLEVMRTSMSSHGGNDLVPDNGDVAISVHRGLMGKKYQSPLPMAREWAPNCYTNLLSVATCCVSGVEPVGATSPPDPVGTQPHWHTESALIWEEDLPPLVLRPVAIGIAEGNTSINICLCQERFLDFLTSLQSKFNSQNPLNIW